MAIIMRRALANSAAATATKVVYVAAKSEVASSAIAQRALLSHG